MLSLLQELYFQAKSGVTGQSISPSKLHPLWV